MPLSNLGIKTGTDANIATVEINEGGTSKHLQRIYNIDFIVNGVHYQSDDPDYVKILNITPDAPVKDIGLFVSVDAFDDFQVISDAVTEIVVDIIAYKGGKPVGIKTYYFKFVVDSKGYNYNTANSANDEGYTKYFRITKITGELREADLIKVIVHQLVAKDYDSETGAYTRADDPPVYLLGTVGVHITLDVAGVNNVSIYEPYNAGGGDGGADGGGDEGGGEGGDFG